MKSTFKLCRWMVAGLMILNTFYTVRAQDVKRIVREDIEWIDVWMPHSNEKDLPRVLLIGNSITRAYNREVDKLLEGKAYVARLATSKSIGDPGLLGEIELVMKYHMFAETTDRIRIRNRIAADYLKDKNVRTNDLFSYVENYPEYYAGGDGVHLVAAGNTALAEKVAKEIEEAIAWKARQSYFENFPQGYTPVEGDKKYYDRPRVVGDYHGQAPVLWCAYALLQ